MMGSVGMRSYEWCCYHEVGLRSHRLSHIPTSFGVMRVPPRGDNLSLRTSLAATLLHRCKRVADCVAFNTAPLRVFINRCRLLRQ
jgi:hypothetical protein